jgi:hypothetical protein
VTEITFGIPVMSSRVAKDWPSIERLLAATLRSVFNQTGAEVRVIIACHERPQIEEVADRRVTVLPVDFDVPRFRWEMELDRMRKMEVIGSELRARGGGWLFALDADDLVARDLAKSIQASATKAVIVRRGYKLDAKAARYQLLNKFYGKCGSCAAVRWETSELPERPLSDNPPVYHEYVETRHYLIPRFFTDRGWTWTFLDEPLLAYVVNHGSNESDILSTLSLRWKLYYMTQRYKNWGPSQDAEFGVSREIREQGLYSGSKLFSTQFQG